MTTATLTTSSAPHFDGLPRRKLAWSWATLALCVLLTGGFVASVSSLPEAPLHGGLAGPAAASDAVAETPCPPTCSPSRG